MQTQTNDPSRVQTMKTNTWILNKSEGTCLGHIYLLLKASELD